MRIAFDLDGTLYDTLPLILDADSRIRKQLSYPDVPRETYRKNFQTGDWRKFYRDLGVREEDLDTIIGLFTKEFSSAELPPLIPGAKDAIYKSEQAVGDGNVYVISNEPFGRVKLRFERDGLAHLLQNVHSPFEGKSGEICRLSQQSPSDSFAYVGDLVSDGEACSEAISKGAKNVIFYGIIHEPAMNPRELMIGFVEKNKNFAQTLNSLEEIGKIWGEK